MEDKNKWNEARRSIFDVVLFAAGQQQAVCEAKLLVTFLVPLAWSRQ